MPLMFRGIWVMLLALIITLTVVQEIEVDPLAPDHVPRATLLAILLPSGARLQVDACSFDADLMRNSDHQLCRLASNKTGGTMIAVPHEYG